MPAILCFFFLKAYGISSQNNSFFSTVKNNISLKLNPMVFPIKALEI